MANNKIQTVSRVSDLPIINKLWDGMTTILAYNKKNYLLDVSKIKGKKIIDITEYVSEENGGKNIIYIKFSDGTTESFYVYNGSVGESGNKGLTGPEGNQGESGYIDERKDGISGTLHIINNSTTQDPNSPWSAYRGKDMNDKIYELNETFMTEEQFDILFNNVTFIYAEYTTSKDNQDVRIFSNDTNNHVVYKKYWTYEDAGLETYYIYNPISKEYDTVVADLWKDIYLGKKEGYFIASSSMLKDETILYYFDKESNTYEQIEKVLAQKTGEDGITSIDVYLGDKRIPNYYIPEIDASVSANYVQLDNKWSFNLNAKSELIPEVYQTEDGINFTRMSDEDVLSIDTTLYARYYYKDGDEYKEITNITAYLATPNPRYYKRNLNGINDNKYSEVKLSDISEINLDDYLIVTKDKLTNTYTFERHHAELLYDEMVYFVDSVSLNSIDLYYYTDSREYYRVSLERTPIGTDEETGETIYKTEQVYTLIPIPNWIYAEFITTDEDQLSLIINANEELGEEDNTVIDDTEESLNTYVKTKNITRIVPGIKDDLYHKNIDGTYTLVDLNKDILYSNAEYYILSDEITYTEILGSDAIANGISELYIKEGNNYSLNRSIINANTIYYVKNNNYILISNPEEYLSTYNLVLFYGEPQILPISIYPLTSDRSFVSIEYDPEKIKLYEDGRIAATIGDNFDTTIIIRSISNESIYGIINVKLTTPVKSIGLSLDNITEINIGDSTVINYRVLPESSFNKNVIWSASNDSVEIVPINETSFKINGLSKSDEVIISGVAEDGFGANNSFKFKVVQPAESIEWNQEDIKFNPDEYYTDAEIAQYNAEHYDEIEAGELERLTPDDIKVPSYYSMVALLGKEYYISPLIKPENTSYPEIVWSSSDPAIAEVIEKNVKVVDSEEVKRIITIEDINEGIKDANGVELTEEQIGTEVVLAKEISHNENKYVLISRSVGEVIINGNVRKYPELSVEVKIRIDQSIELINVYPSTLSLNVETKKKLIAEILPTTAVNGTISWYSKNPSIVSVSPTGTINAIMPGSTNIIVHAEDGSEVEGICNVTVTIPAKDIILNGNTINGIIYVGIGKTTVITPEITYNTNNYPVGTTLGINWNSSNSEVASIDNNGTVTGLSLGKTTIIANAKDGSGVFGTIQVQVIKLIEEISFDINEIEMELGDSLVLIPNITPVDASNEIVIWTSSDETIAKVKESGIVYALSSGTCTITAATTDGSNLTATCNITIL